MSSSPKPVAGCASRERTLAAAEKLRAQGQFVPRHVCWLAQQAAEKALKAALILEGVDFPFRHDLDALRNLLPEGWSVKEEYPDLSELTEWAVEARYPGDWPEPTVGDADRALAQARGVPGEPRPGLREARCATGGVRWR